MSGKKQVNNGSATVEMCFVMPVVLWICMNIIFVFLDVIGEGVIQGNSYTAIYTYTEEQQQKQEQDLNQRYVMRTDEYLICDGTVNNAGNTYSGKPCLYKAEYNLCTMRLRRWQLYGDVLRE